MIKDNTILIWKYLLPLLNTNEELLHYMPATNIYPIVAFSDTKFPYIVYKRDSLIPQYTKHMPGVGGWVNNIVISISVYSDNYDESVYIANLVRNILEDYRYSGEDILIHNIELNQSYETYSENGFQQNLVFTLTAE